MKNTYFSQVRSFVYQNKKDRENQNNNQNKSKILCKNQNYLDSRQFYVLESH